MKEPPLPTSDDRQMWDIWLSAFRFPAMAAADDLGVFQLLEGGPATADEVAERLSLDATAAQVLLGTITSSGLLDRKGGLFSLTDLSRTYLLPTSPYYWGGSLRFFRGIPVTFEDMRAALRPEAPAPEGQPVEDHTLPEPDVARVFTDAMHGLSFPAAMAVSRWGDFGGVRRLLDVGGGSGSYCIALALRYPDMQLTVADTPATCFVTRRYIAEYGVDDRIETLPFDAYNDPWPAGYDAHFFGNMFHGQNRAACLHLASSSYGALLPGGRIYLQEVLLDEGKDGPATAAEFSLAMHYWNGRGSQFTASEIEGFLREAGFGRISIISSYGYYSLIMGIKP